MNDNSEGKYDGNEFEKEVGVGYKAGEVFMDLITKAPVFNIKGELVSERVLWVGNPGGKDFTKGFNAAVHDHLQESENFDYFTLFERLRKI